MTKNKSIDRVKETTRTRDYWLVAHRSPARYQKSVKRMYCVHRLQTIPPEKEHDSDDAEEEE
jgi:hypothetical protein